MIRKVVRNSTQNNKITNFTTINFDFENQNLFPLSESEQHFDVEAFFEHEGKLFLFTKDRSKPFEGKTNMYQLDAIVGTQEAVLIQTFVTSQEKKEGAITSADISPDGKKMVLLSEQKLFLFTNFTSPNFFLEKLKSLICQ